jgi:hypothetical protein
MDAYEKLFVKMEAERKVAEEEEAKKELGGKAGWEARPSIIIQEGITLPDQDEVEKNSPRILEMRKQLVTACI